jgi:probable HAF family extracellular repeat protein
MRAVLKVNNWNRAWGLTLFSIGMLHYLPVQAQQDTQTVRAEQGDDLRDHNSKHHHYKLIDLGTFGGPESYTNPAFTLGSHHQINRRGVVVGGAATSIPTTPTSNFLVCGGLDGLVPFVNHAFEWQHGSMTDLGALAGADNCSVATSINGRGEVVGFSENGVVDPVLGTNEVHAVMWKDGEIRDLGTLGGNGSTADAINERGQVVGFAFNAIPDPVSLIYFALAGLTNGTQTRAYLWENGVMQDLGTLGGPDAQAVSVNERGQVAGYSYTNSTPNPVTGLPTIHPFLWTKEHGMKDLGTLGGTNGLASCECGDLNNRGQVIGESTLAGDRIAHPFLWDGQQLIDLYTSTTGGTPISADALNDEGEIVGAGTFPNRPFDAFLWKDGVAMDLGAVDGDCFSWAHAVNSRTQVVGQSFSCDGSIIHTFLWENGSMVDLNTLVPASNLRLVDTRSMNERGEIAGIGLPPGCRSDTQCGHAFVLIPCDENHADVEGCDYETVDAATAAQVRSAQITESSAPARGAKFAPIELMTRTRAMARRNQRFGTLQK